MMKISKEQLLTIDSLNLANDLDEMDDVQFGEYEKTLSNFIENTPAQEKQLSASFEAKDCEEFSKNLLSTLDLLNKIKAKDLAQSSFTLLAEVRAERYDTAEAYLTEFLSKISMLSIDLQMAQYRDAGTAGVPENVTPDKDICVQSDTNTGESKEKVILAVDDLSFLLTTLKTALQNTPYKFIGVTSGMAALKCLNNYRPDLFILDIEMPEMDGYELAQKIKERGFNAPVIFLTGNAKKEYVVKAIQVGAVDFIVKPVIRAQVLEKINKYIES